MAVRVMSEMDSGIRQLFARMLEEGEPRLLAVFVSPQSVRRVGLLADEVHARGSVGAGGTVTV